MVLLGISFVNEIAQIGICGQTLKLFKMHFCSKIRCSCVSYEECCGFDECGGAVMLRVCSSHSDMTSLWVRRLVPLHAALRHVLQGFSSFS